MRKILQNDCFKRSGHPRKCPCRTVGRLGVDQEEKAKTESISGAHFLIQTEIKIIRHQSAPSEFHYVHHVYVTHRVTMIIHQGTTRGHAAALFQAETQTQR